MNEELLDELEEFGREVCCTVYQFMLCNQTVMKHPAAPMLPDEHWQTICHNMAFVAGSVADGSDLTVQTDDGVGTVLATTKTGTMQ